MKKNKRIYILCVLTSLILILLFLTICKFKSKRLVDDNGKLPEFIMQMYSIDGVTWKDTEGVKYDFIEDELFIKGHFSKLVSDDKYIFLFLKNTQVEMWVNNESVYTYGYDDSSDSVMNVLGTSWEKINSISIGEDDECIFKIKAFSGKLTESDIENFANYITAGTEEEMLVKLINRDDIYLILVFGLGIIGIVLLLVSFILWSLYIPDTIRQIFLCLFLLSCCSWFLVNSETYVFLSNRPKFNYLAEIYCQYSISFFVLTFVKAYVKEWRKKVFTIFQIWTLVYSVIVTIANIIQGTDFYKYMDIGATFNIIFICWIIISLFYETFIVKNEEARRLLVSGIPIIIGAAGEIYNYIVQPIYAHTIAFEIGVVGFIILQMYYFAYHIKEQSERTRNMAKVEAELSNNKIAIMLGQIHPHFLYNALIAIKGLCESDPKRAEEMIDRFAFFLRGNMNSLTEKKRIPFKKELEHVSHYLELEKMRFGERLNIQMDIKTLDFTIPTLTLQTIVENAVRHGILKKIEGGCVTVATEETENQYIISVIDDGIGYNIYENNYDSSEHIGIFNVKNRLAMQCNGTLEITSTVGEGTKVIMYIPKEY